MGGAGGGGPSIKGFVTSAVLGGVATEVTGGKFKNGAASAAFMYAVSAGANATANKIQANKSESNTTSIEKLESLPENPRAVYEEGLKLAKAQRDLGVDGNVKYDDRHAFCPEKCTTGTIKYRNSVGEAIDFLKNNSAYGLLLGAHVDGISTIYPSATVSNSINYPIGTKEYRNYITGYGAQGFEVTGAKSVLSVIVHETGHRDGLTHGRQMERREYDSIMRSRK